MRDKARIKRYYRSREDIYCYILEGARDIPLCRYSHLIFSSRLPYVHGKAYVERLLTAELITNAEPYRITKKGTAFLKNWYEMRECLAGFH